MNSYTIAEHKCAVVDIDGELRDFIDRYRTTGSDFFGGVGFSDGETMTVLMGIPVPVERQLELPL